MENQDSNQSIFDLSFDENTKLQLKGAATWGGFAAVISIIGSILGVINYFIQKSNPKTYNFEGFSELRTQTESSGNLASLIITFIVALVLFYFLNKFSRSAKAGVDGSNQQLIGEGLGSLSNYFKTIGVLLIICIVFVGLALLIVGLKT